MNQVDLDDTTITEETELTLDTSQDGVEGPRQEDQITDEIKGFIQDFDTKPYIIHNKKLKVLENIKNKVCACLRDNKPIPIYDNLFSILTSPDILILAYQKLSKNKGAMTPGTEKQSNDGVATADGTSLKTILKLSDSLKNNEFKITPIRRILIPKPGKKEKRPLGLPDFNQKLVQEGIRIILDSIYDPIMEHQGVNFGFRSNKSTHDALDMIAVKGKGSFFAIEGDIQGAYDNVNHDLLIDILSKRIRDKKFLNLIHKFCKAGIFYSISKNVTNSIIGVPQGGIASPILFNVYMMEFDRFVEEELRTTINYINKRQSRNDGPEQKRYSRSRNKYRRADNRYKKYISDQNKPISLYTNKEITKLNELHKQRNFLRLEVRKTPYTNQAKNTLRILYVRYADDWILLTNGKKTLCTLLKNKISSYLQTYLHLKLSDTKTSITEIRKEPARFLGFEIRGYNQTRLHYTANNTLARTGKTLRLFPDTKRLISRLQLNGYCDEKGFPTSKNSYTVLDDSTIIIKFNSIMMGLGNYYFPLLDYTSSMARYHYILHYSAMKTLAHKHDTSISKLIKKHGYPITMTHQETRSDEVKMKHFQLLGYQKWREQCLKTAKLIRRKKTKKQPYHETIKPDFFNQYKINWRTRVKMDWRCSICGDSDSIQMHHIKHLRKLKLTGFDRVVQSLNRKQIPVCFFHHQQIHNGTYDGIGLNDIYDNRIPRSENYFITRQHKKTMNQ